MELPLILLIPALLFATATTDDGPNSTEEVEISTLPTSSPTTLKYENESISETPSTPTADLTTIPTTETISTSSFSIQNGPSQEYTTDFNQTTTPTPLVEPKTLTFENSSAPTAINATSNEIYYNSTSDVETVTTVNSNVEDKVLYLTFQGPCSNRNTPNTTFNFLDYQQDEINRNCQAKIILKIIPNDESVLDQLQLLVGRIELYQIGAALKLVNIDASYKFGKLNDTIDDNTNATYLAGLGYNEFVSYVVIGSCFGAAVLIGLCLICVKCIRCGEKNELNDIPHLTLRLEDYALTRIPRPNTVYNENVKTPIISDDTSNASVQGLARSTDGREDNLRMNRAYDTGVVPMDEYHGHYATPSYHNGTHGGNEMRTFRKSGADMNVRPREIEERVSNSNNESTNSTEKLARDFYRRKGNTTPYGEENPTFKT